MKLLDAYAHPEAAEILWRLLSEREAYQSISHKRMPTWIAHRAFVEARPYLHWYLIDCGDIVGSVYLTDKREIGIAILRGFRGNGYGRLAVLQILEKHPGPAIANINPNNRSSIDMFRDLGFQHTAVTYELAS